MSESSAAPAVIVLMPGDNVGIAARPIEAGESIVAAGVALTALGAIPLAHKIAIGAIAAGNKVVRCGVPIGSATRAIAAGEHVHTQNLVSDYMPTYTLDGPLRFEERAR